MEAGDHARFRTGVRPRDEDPRELGPVNQGVYVIVDDGIDSHYERAHAAGAEIVRELHDTDYGSRNYVARDPEGNLWSFGTYRPE